MAIAYQTIRYHRDGHLATLTLARPEKRNAVNPSMRSELADLSERLQTDETLRCLIVTGDGPTFCAGIDLAEAMTARIDRPGSTALLRRCG